jgi:hypothetical protein
MLIMEKGKNVTVFTMQSDCDKNEKTSGNVDSENWTRKTRNEKETNNGNRIISLSDSIPPMLCLFLGFQVSN